MADRVSMKEDSHMLKHWVCDHPDLLEPTKFKFRIIRSFQDPLTRQLAEAVRVGESNDCCLEGGPPLPLVIPEVNLPPDLVDKLADVLGAMTWHLTQKVVSSFLLGIWDIPLLSR